MREIRQVFADMVIDNIPFRIGEDVHDLKFEPLEFQKGDYFFIDEISPITTKEKNEKEEEIDVVNEVEILFMVSRKGNAFDKKWRYAKI
jgi:hypothetical protein